ncbi:MAG TPA: Tex family protein, partial [Opitutales bacterium]|nr:Tex family protein [Opitutales bacterium]
NLSLPQVAATAKLLAEGATVPFIARYRKEATGSLDEVEVMAVRDRLGQLLELDTRRAAILKSLEERNLLTDELGSAINGAETLSALEDIYQPFRPKRRTRAMIAKEQGLEPLADLLQSQREDLDPAKEAAAFVDAEKGVDDVEKALSGARDILAERVSDDAEARAKMRRFYRENAILSSRVLSGKEEEGAKFRDYFDWKEPLAKAPSHRILAMRRGETEGILIFRIQPPEEEALNLITPLFVTGNNRASEQVRMAVEDGFKRLLGPAMETEMRIESKERADKEAIRVFADNLRELLLASPLGERRTLAIDPGFRTGCKIVMLDRQGKLLHDDIVFIGQSERMAEEAAAKIRGFVSHFKIEAIAIGNGTAGRETEKFVRGLGLPASIPVVMVNESGASIYSASEVAREEFPDHDLTVRGAVSIGRRLMDPLAELVKLDPKSIGVGQYQHDVDQVALKDSLDDVVISSVNRVGVEVNTASKQLLTYVSGIGPQIASNIVRYRDENGPFKTRAELKKVARLGPKAFEQSAGFLRVRDGANPLDASAVHPESYGIVDAMARDLGCEVVDLMKDASLRKKIKIENYVTETAGLPTLTDILEELSKPGRDPREEFEVFSFAEGVHSVGDLKEGQKLPGVVTNVTAFGAFVDVGVQQDGLVHVSQLADRFVKDPNEIVKVGQRVQVTVIEVDEGRNRIGLSMRAQPELRGGGRRAGGHSGPQGGGRRDSRPVRSKPETFGGSWFDDALKKKR